MHVIPWILDKLEGCPTYYKLFLCTGPLAVLHRKQFELGEKVAIIISVSHSVRKNQQQNETGDKNEIDLHICSLLMTSFLSPSSDAACDLNRFCDES